MRKKSNITNSQRLALCAQYKLKPYLAQSELGKWFEEVHKVKIRNPSTISQIFSTQYDWLNNGSNYQLQKHLVISMLIGDDNFRACSEIIIIAKLIIN